MCELADNPRGKIGGGERIGGFITDTAEQQRRRRANGTQTWLELERRCACNKMLDKSKINVISAHRDATQAASGTSNRRIRCREAAGPYCAETRHVLATRREEDAARRCLPFGTGIVELTAEAATVRSPSRLPCTAPSQGDTLDRKWHHLRVPSVRLSLHIQHCYYSRCLAFAGGEALRHWPRPVASFKSVLSLRSSGSTFLGTFITQVFQVLPSSAREYHVRHCFSFLSLIRSRVSQRSGKS